jgi:gamma-glutamyltranspeptidase / glutathione hydrolase
VVKQTSGAKTRRENARHHLPPLACSYLIRTMKKMPLRSLAHFILSVIVALPLLAHGRACGFARAEGRLDPQIGRAHALTAANGMVVAQEAIAARIGADILQKGGNAVDAAVATGFALAVTYPRAGNIGGGGFMVIHRADGQGASQDTTIDYREAAPAAIDSKSFLDAQGNADPQKSRDSALAIGVRSPSRNTARASSRSPN